MLRPRFKDLDGKERYFRGQYVLSVYKNILADRFSSRRYAEYLIDLGLSPVIFPIAYALTFHPDSHFYLKKIED